MSNATPRGRHRAPGRHAAKRSTHEGSNRTAVKASAILAASGGLVAALAVPATASTDTAAQAAASGHVVAAIVAPTPAAPAAPVIGLMAFTAVAKPVTRTTTQAASRGATRTPLSLPAPTAFLTRPTVTVTPPVPLPAATTVAHGGVLAIAASLSGIPYVYGGTTPAGFDCSGFTSYVFRQVGISLPRTAAEQQAAAAPVAIPQPGDLVFFGYPAYHVGIYAGGGMMYDSPQSGTTTGLHPIWTSGVTYGRP